MKKILAAKWLCVILVLLLVSQVSAAPKKRKPASSSSYNTLMDWRLDDKFRPSVVLRLTNGKKLTLVFERRDGMLVLPDKQELIPEGTRFTVPKNYMALCNYYHTECVSGKASRTEDSEGTIRTLFEQGAEVEYVRPSGLIMVSYADVASERFSVSSSRKDDYDDDDEDDYDYEPDPQSSLRKQAREFENRSVKPEDVIKTYDLSSREAEELIRKHNEALKLRSNREKADVYARMFEEYDGDYLAAYYVALANFNMGRGGQALTWCDKALAVNPLYYPAKYVRKKAEGIVK
ncbi:MAG: hypothetical protein IJR85_01605 [Synergistaceae bacterium]|nr:hypothetical protein [Synergistaceae bacterium]